MRNSQVSEKSQNGFQLSKGTDNSNTETVQGAKQKLLIEKLLKQQSVNPKTGSRSLSKSSLYDSVSNHDKESMLLLRQTKWQNKPTDANFGQILMKRETNCIDQLELLRLDVNKLKIPPAVCTMYDQNSFKKVMKNPSEYDNENRSQINQIKAIGGFNDMMRVNFGLNNKQLDKILKLIENSQASKDAQASQNNKELHIDAYLNPKTVPVKRATSGGLTIRQRNKLFFDPKFKCNDKKFLEKCLTGSNFEDLQNSQRKSNFGNF